MHRDSPRSRQAPHAGPVALVLALCALAAGCSGRESGAPAPTSATTAPVATGPLPPRVNVRAEPDGVALADPEFTALPGARADFGRLHGAVYRIEMPDRWNRKLVLFMHGFEEFSPEASVSAPDFRHYLIGQGYAWGASSFSNTSMIPGRAADETAALWDHFARKYGRPARTYINGFSMGGMATHIAAERYADRFDGALALCGSAGLTPALEISTDFFVAGAFVAGVTQSEFDASNDVARLIRERIEPALRDPVAHARFEDILIDLTGGPRAFDREGVHLEEETNWRRAVQLVAARLASNGEKRYRLGPATDVPSATFDRAAPRLPTNAALRADFLAGNEVTGRLRMPLLTMHTTGDGQVPIDQALALRRRVHAAGRQALLVQRVVRDPGHCGFTTAESEAGFEALVAWVERGAVPVGTDLRGRDLTRLDPTFELSPRPGTPEADQVPGARDRVVFRGAATLDGAPFDARWLGAVVLRDSFATACQLTLVPVQRGRYEIAVMGGAESEGCGAAGADVVLWTFVGGERFSSRGAARWPDTGGTVAFAAEFARDAPAGAMPPSTSFSGEVYGRDGRRFAPGTRVEAYVGDTRCGVASVRRTGSFSGYILTTVGPQSIAACSTGATLTFRIDGRPALETAVNEPGRDGPLDLTAR